MWWVRYGLPLTPLVFSSTPSGVGDVFDGVTADEARLYRSLAPLLILFAAAADESSKKPWASCGRPPGARAKANA